MMHIKSMVRKQFTCSLRIFRSLCMLLCLLAAMPALAQLLDPSFDPLPAQPAPTLTLSEAEALVAVGQYQELLEQFRAVTDGTVAGTVAAAPELIQLYADVLHLTGRLSEAERLYSELPDYLPARYGLSWLTWNRGDTQTAQTSLTALLDDASKRSTLNAIEWTALGNAARLLGAHDPQWFTVAVDYYEAALTQDANAVPARLALGELLLEKYNNQEAQSVFQEALQRDPLNAQALLGLARSQHFDYAPEAQETVQRSLEINPNLVAARVFLAQLYLESEQYDSAINEANQALRINPLSLPALSLRAAAYFLSDEEARFEADVQAVLAHNPRYAELYNTLAEIAARNRLYQEAAGFARQAIELDPLSWRGHGLLGLNQLRLGQIEQGIASLERAFEGDPYNVWIKNTLDLTDSFADYQLTADGPFIFMLHRDESALLLPYLQPLAQEAYEYYAKQYGYRAKTPIRVEFYPRSADFSVRTAGVAGIGLLGVSFGPVIGMDSPTAREQGSFNWGSTFWHELAHTFHLGLSAHRVPRWFSEGLAVYEERQAKPSWGGDPSPDFLAAYRAGKLPPVSAMNSAFVRPSYPQQIIHAYYLASLVFDYLDEQEQINQVPAMLQAFARGESVGQMLQSVLQVDETEFDAGFDAYIRQRFALPLSAIGQLGRIMEQPGTLEDLVLRAQWQPQRYELQLQAGLQLLQDNDETRAEVFLRRAQALFPEYAGDDSAYWWLAQLYMRQEQQAAAIEQLQRMTAINGEHLPSHLALARLLRQQGDFTQASEVLERALYITPFDRQIHQQLAQLYELLGRWDDHVRAREAVLALGPTDLSAARFQLALAYYQAGRYQPAHRAVLDALELAPHYADAQDLLLEVRELQSPPTPVD